jgi:translation initiation factor 2B subunit (eIF-2B alpha/beta/delta family)
MTFGYSHTVHEFLLAAARKRQFEVIVPESSPSNTGRRTAVELAQVSITCP